MEAFQTLASLGKAMDSVVTQSIENPAKARRKGSKK